jgi:50S ribosomal protein L16 3-hydroxylase
MITSSSSTHFSLRCFLSAIILSPFCESWIMRPLGQRGCPRIPMHLSANPSSSKTIETIEGPWDASAFGTTDCWGRRPLILRNAFDFESLPSWEEILELACESSDDDDYDEDDVVASRLIDHEPGTLDTYRVEFGPFPAEDLNTRLQSNTKKRASTLVVNDVDRYIREVSDWMDEKFDFMPRWRRDDAQVSLAAVSGGIGPHVDNYDVFLVQAGGSRQWEVGLEEISVEEEYGSLVPESQVRILNLTTAPATVKVELQAGDCLYLPPRIMHFGTSNSNDCVTLSVGCRAPSAGDIVSRMAEAIAVSTTPSAVQRYADTDIFQVPDKELSNKVKKKMKEAVRRAIEDFLENDEDWDDLVGKVITEPNRPSISYPMPLAEMDDDWRSELGCWGEAARAINAVEQGKGLLRRAEGVAFAWSKGQQTGSYRLYAHGRVFEVEGVQPSASSLCCRIANGLPLDKIAFEDFEIHESASIRNFLGALIEEGFLYGDDYEDEN